MEGKRTTRASNKALVVAEERLAITLVRNNEPKDRNGPVERDFVVFCMTQMTDVYNMAPLSDRQMQAFLDLFRADNWINRHFQAACLWAARNCPRFPSYADFVRYRREEGLDETDN